MRIQGIKLALILQRILHRRSLQASRQVGACKSGAMLTHAIAMHLMPRRVTTSLASFSTAMAHVVIRTPTLRQRAQPTQWEMLNVPRSQKLQAMLTLSRWALACCLLVWVPSHELFLSTDSSLKTLKCDTALTNDFLCLLFQRAFSRREVERAFA